MPPSHYAAGVLPMTFIERGTRPIYLVGRDLRDLHGSSPGGSSWSDWAGKAERCDHGDPVHTAAREMWEETFGQLLSAKAMAARLKRGRCVRLLSRTQNGNLFHFFVAVVPYRPDFCAAFERSLSFLQARCAGSGSGSARSMVEKIGAQWVTAGELFGEELPKRSVFAQTIAQHRGILSRLTDAWAWQDAVAENAEDDAWNMT